MIIHELKIDTVHFQQHLSDVKNCEIRRDRGFETGDELILVECLTGEKHHCVVTGCLRNYPGIEPGYCLLYTRRKK